MSATPRPSLSRRVLTLGLSLRRPNCESWWATWLANWWASALTLLLFAFAWHLLVASITSPSRDSTYAISIAMQEQADGRWTAILVPQSSPRVEWKLPITIERGLFWSRYTFPNPESRQCVEGLRRSSFPEGPNGIAAAKAWLAVDDIPEWNHRLRRTHMPGPSSDRDILLAALAGHQEIVHRRWLYSLSQYTRWLSATLTTLSALLIANWCFQRFTRFIRQRRIDAMTCSNCLYSLKGLPQSAPCPECGTDINPSDAKDATNSRKPPDKRAS